MNNLRIDGEIVSNIVTTLILVDATGIEQCVHIIQRTLEGLQRGIIGQSAVSIPVTGHVPTILGLIKL